MLAVFGLPLGPFEFFFCCLPLIVVVVVALTVAVMRQPDSRLHRGTVVQYYQWKQDTVLIDVEDGAQVIATTSITNLQPGQKVEVRDEGDGSWTVVGGL